MTGEKADAELDEMGLEMIERVMLRGVKEVREYAVIRKGAWPTITTWFSMEGDGLRWHPTWQEAYAEAMQEAPF